jgi:antitoxin ParD1/3/4
MATGGDSRDAPEDFVTKLVAWDAAIARGLDDAEAGRTKPSSEIFDRLEARLANTADRT